MSVLALMLPSSTFYKWAFPERSRCASSMLVLYQRMHEVHLSTRSECLTLRDVIAWTGLKQDIETSMQAWQLEVDRMQSAFGRSKVMAHSAVLDVRAASAGDSYGQSGDALGVAT